jgi:hypothetical protein
MVSLERLGRHKPEAGGFCLDLGLIIRGASSGFLQPVRLAGRRRRRAGNFPAGCEAGIKKRCCDQQAGCDPAGVRCAAWGSQRGVFRGPAYGGTGQTDRARAQESIGTRRGASCCNASTRCQENPELRSRIRWISRHRAAVVALRAPSRIRTHLQRGGRGIGIMSPIPPIGIP